MAKREIRIRVVAVLQRENLRNCGTDHVLAGGSDTTFLGTGWRVEPCGALSILSEGSNDSEQVDYTFGPGRWLEVFRE